MRRGVADVVDFEIAVKANLPALFRIEADERLFNWPGLLGPRFVCDVREGPAARLELGADQDACLAGIIYLGEGDVRDLFPHVEGRADFLTEGLAGNIRLLEKRVDRPHDPAIDGVWRFGSGAYKGVSDFGRLWL